MRVQMRVRLGTERITLSRVLRIGGVLLGCLLGADALAHLGALHFTFFDMGELGVAGATVIALVPRSYRLVAIAGTFAVAAIMGVARMLYQASHAILGAGSSSPVTDRYVIPAIIYGAYLLGFLWVRRLARKPSEIE